MVGDERVEIARGSYDPTPHTDKIIDKYIILSYHTPTPLGPAWLPLKAMRHVFLFKARGGAGGTIGGTAWIDIDGVVVVCRYVHTWNTSPERRWISFETRVVVSP